ncbi:MAG TPA: hypothetical protein VJR22_06915 [Candidatus Nitrosotalea sp.]|nr:hypothetical protein [Nitrososphaerota archaeon]HKU33559.1 hypothetical protein [Candidatus Nitrosotalea sp.]
MKNLVFGSLLSITLIALVGISSEGHAWALTSSSSSTSLASDAIKNNPLAMKILQNIEISKQRIAQMQQNTINMQQVEQKRSIAKTLEEQAYQSLQTKMGVNDSKNSYARFVSTVQNNNAKKVFSGQFSLLSDRVDAGHAAMKQVLDNGGTWEDAMNAFSQYAAIKRTDMVQANQNLNLQYGLADATVQSSFDKNGMLPDDYIKMPSAFLSR